MVATTSMLPARELQAGEKLLLKRELGRGGFASCCKAVWTPAGSETGLTVACKVLLPQFHSPASVYYKQFVEEATLLRSLAHQNIVGCQDLLVLPAGYPGLKDSYAAPTLAMILDYAEDGTLQGLIQNQLIQPHKLLYTFAQAFSMVLDIGRAVAHLHCLSPPIVHRDLKLENMLLTKEDRRYTVRLTDFGLHSRLDGSRRQSTRRTKQPVASDPRRPTTPPLHSFSNGTSSSEAQPSVNSRDVAVHCETEQVYNLTQETGSPIYMAPEVFLAQPYNEKADVFSFGIIMYEVFGRTLLVFTHIGPGKGRLGTTDQYVRAVAQSGWRPSKPNALGTELWRVIESCWQEDPNTRPRMADVVRELQHLRQRMTPDERPSTAPTGSGGGDSWLKGKLGNLF